MPAWNGLHEESQDNDQYMCRKNLRTAPNSREIQEENSAQPEIYYHPNYGGG